MLQRSVEPDTYDSLVGATDEQRLIAALRPVVDALGAELIAIESADDGDVAIEWDGRAVVAVRLPRLHESLERLLTSVELELGGPLASLTREQQQFAIRRLDELGAFTLRRAVEDVSKAIGISRITVYNYLNALYR